VVTGTVVGYVNEVTLRQARLVLGWVTIYGHVSHLHHIWRLCSFAYGALQIWILLLLLLLLSGYITASEVNLKPSTLHVTVKWVSAFGLS